MSSKKLVASLRQELSEAQDIIREYVKDHPGPHDPNALKELKQELQDRAEAFYEQAKASLANTGYLVLLDTSNRQIFNTYVPYGQAPPTSANPDVVEQMKLTKQPIVSDLFASIVARQFVYNISIPVVRDGELRYVLGLGLLPTDLLALALFVTVGLFNHQGGLSLTGYARDLLPIGAAWFAAGAVFGLYRQPRWRTLLATWATGVTAGIAIRQAIVWHLHGDDAAFLAIAHGRCRRSPTASATRS